MTIATSSKSVLAFKAAFRCQCHRDDCGHNGRCIREMDSLQRLTWNFFGFELLKAELKGKPAEFLCIYCHKTAQTVEA